jgi:hypothetical protein
VGNTRKRLISTQLSAHTCTSTGPFSVVFRCIPGHVRSALPLNAIPRQPRTSHGAAQQITRVLDLVATCNPKVWNFPEAEVPIGVWGKNGPIVWGNRISLAEGGQPPASPLFSATPPKIRAGWSRSSFSSCRRSGSLLLQDWIVAKIATSSSKN